MLPSRVPLALGMVALCGLWPTVGRADEAKASGRVSLRTVTLSRPLENAQRIFLHGELSGTTAAGVVILDPNVCHHNHFGDETMCTLIAPRVVPVSFALLKIADPSGKARSLYEVSPKTGTFVNRLCLVVPSRPQDSFRLVSQDRGGKRRTVTLEHWDTPSTLSKDRESVVMFGNNTVPILTAIDSSWELGVATSYYAQQVPGAVLIRADGTTPSGGYQVKLDATPITIWPPQHVLLWKKPESPSTTVLTPFRVWACFRADEKVEQVIVHDANGRHEVEVEQVLDLSVK